MQNRRSGKVELRSLDSVHQWLLAPTPAVFLRLDLSDSDVDPLVAGADLTDCSFLGCSLARLTSAAIERSGAFRIEALRGLQFDPFRTSLYSPADLYDQLNPDDPSTYENCFDRLVYCSVSDPVTHVQHAVDVDVAIMRRLHDAAIGEALAEALPLDHRRRCVAVMGGHDEPRTSATYRTVVTLARDLTREGFVIATGGGPGVMEAANLGGYLAGFTQASQDSANDGDRLNATLAILAEAPDYKHELWLTKSVQARNALGPPTDAARAASFGIPTWFYGHEPPNVFATHVAKYFENSLREEGLLAIALGGVIFAPGNAGTVQEIFQDACQNYYRTYDNTRSPMILFGADYWSGAAATPKAKPVEELLRVLANEKEFASLVHATDDPAVIKALLLANQHQTVQAEQH
jgi:predicted Rossmann-fold nucleotide-binding protein